MSDADLDALDGRALWIQVLQQRVVSEGARGQDVEDLLADVEALRFELVAGGEQDALDTFNRLERLAVEAGQVLKRDSSLGFHAPRSKIQRAVFFSQPLSCWAPPRLKECDVRAAPTPAAGATRSRTRLTYAPAASGRALRSSTSGTSGDSVTAVGCAWSGRARATASKGHVAKSASGKSDSPCSSDVFTRTKRRKKTPAPSMERFRFWIIDRSDARPNRHKRQRRAASW
ncbi:hypothetical protein PHYSODRAFT_488156 [Phytophthora sojae]|uniref:Uncharacterized protein n=1 Tax=Phytophthora sojae (strain P6497) TaxID=1094619 RepID=G4Z8T9_PHYSP|nr:hypothetical protein PHYSODRAFT_488156 [Phytophthora sojae]EGZ19710.1 hypothetical protein PHYSODRAFT_488156 [Phytophthora sojae]|eukprot:XP_009522427.1 hypothetical protein PHYSODRAFT_488156 [Phytophthora sojae]